MADLVVIGAGIVGLAFAAEANRRGLSVTVIERDDRPVGASVRNFGHGCFTAQSGQALRYALAARAGWLRYARAAGFWLRECGTVVVARAEDELAVLAELAELRGDQVRLLDGSQVTARIGAVPAVIGGALLPMDVRIDPRSAVPELAAWLADQRVRFRWRTSARLVEPGSVRTSRGEVRGRWIVLAVGHDLDRHLPGTAQDAGVRRCALNMLRVATPGGRRIDPAVLTGSSLLRYSGFSACPSVSAVRARLTVEEPQMLAAQVNLMLTQTPDGDLLIGDTHEYAVTPGPFRQESNDELLLRQAAALLGVGRLQVRERWRGVYASAPGREFLVAAPLPQVRAVSVTTGIGMTTAFGLAPVVLDELVG